MRRIEPYFPLSNSILRVDDRRIVSGIIFVIRNGLRWRDAPARYPHYYPRRRATLSHPDCSGTPFDQRMDWGLSLHDRTSIQTPAGRMPQWRIVLSGRSCQIADSYRLNFCLSHTAGRASDIRTSRAWRNAHPEAAIRLTTQLRT